MIDTLNPQADGTPNWTAGLAQPAPHDYPEVKPNPYTPPSTPGSLAPDTNPLKVDHLKEIAELVSGLAETSPSGANTIGAKIMYHVNALADPAAFDKAEAEKAKADKEQARKDAEKLKKIKGDRKAVA